MKIPKKLLRIKKHQNRLILFSIIIIGLISTYQIWLNLDKVFCEDVVTWAIFNHKLYLKAIFEDGQFPLFNPYTFGGVPHYSNPQSQIFSPFIIFSFLFGEIIGINISIIFSVVLAGVSMYFVTKKLKFSLAGIFFSSVVFMLNGYFFLDVTHHLMNTWSYFLFPFVYYYSTRLNLRNSIILGIIFSLFVLNGSSYFLFYSLLFSILLVGFQTLEKRKLEPMKLFILSILIFLGLSALKLVGTYAFIQKYFLGYSYKDVVEGSYDIKILLKSLLIQNVEYLKNQTYNFWEYGAYVGLIPLSLAILGIKNNRKDILIFLIFIFIVLGSTTPINILGLISHLPFYSTLRVPTRYLVVPIFYLSFYSGSFIGNFAKKHKGIALLLIIFVVADLITIYDYTDSSFCGVEKNVIKSQVFYQNVTGEVQYYSIPKNYGKVNGYDWAYINFKPKVLENQSLIIGDYTDYELKVNSLEISGVTKPILINMNYIEDLQPINATIKNESGIIRLIPKESNVGIFYDPKELYIGLSITVLTLVLLTYFFIFRNKKIKKIIYNNFLFKKCNIFHKIK